MYHTIRTAVLRSGPRLALSLALTAIPCHAVLAQLTVSNLSMTRGANAAAPLSATEAAFHVTIRNARFATQSEATADSLRILTTANTRHWVQRLDVNTIRGIQLDTYGDLRISADDEKLAQQSIATRLATPGLSVDDRAYTYLTAISAFLRTDVPAQLGARLPLVERYASALSALGPETALPQFIARRTLADAYYILGRPVDVVRHSLQAVALVPKMEFSDRRAMYWAPDFYAQTVEVLAGQPDAPARIAKLNAELTAATTPSAALVARDSAFAREGARYQASLKEMVTVGMRLGTRAQNIEGNYWANFPTPGALTGEHTMNVADGKIRVLEMGHFSCPQCMEALVALQRVQNRFTGIQVVYASATHGSWGNRIVEPDVEAAHLTEHFTKKLNITFPLSIWKGALKPTEEDGMLPENFGPNFKHYPLASKPNIYVIDGKGIIRRVFIGTLTTEAESQLVRLIGFLERETTGTAPASTPASTTSSSR